MYTWVYVHMKRCIPFESACQFGWQPLVEQSSLTVDGPWTSSSPFSRMPLNIHGVGPAVYLQNAGLVSTMTLRGLGRSLCKKECNYATYIIRVPSLASHVQVHREVQKTTQLLCWLIPNENNRWCKWWIACKIWVRWPLDNCLNFSTFHQFSQRMYIYLWMWTQRHTWSSWNPIKL